MGFLMLVWWSCCVLAATSLLVFLLLIVRRLLDERRQLRDVEIADQVKEKLFLYMLEEDSKQLPGFSRPELPIARAVAIDICQLVRGHEKERLTEVLENLGFKRECMRDLQRGSLMERMTSATALQLFADNESAESLVKALDDKSPQVRMAAADSLLAIDRLPDADLLVEKLQEKNLMSGHDAMNLFRGMARKSPRMLITLANMSVLDDESRLIVLDAMSEAADFSVLNVLYKYSRHENYEFRLAVMEALAALGHPQAEPVVSRALRDEDWRVRAEALNAVGSIGLDSLQARALTLLTQDENWWVRFHAAEALLRLGEHARAQLENIADDDSPGGQLASLVLDEHGYHEHRVGA